MWSSSIRQGAPLLCSFVRSLMFKVALHDVDDRRLSEELLYSTYIAYLFTSSPIDSLYTLYINYLHYNTVKEHSANVRPGVAVECLATCLISVVVV